MTKVTSKPNNIIIASSTLHQLPCFIDYVGPFKSDYWKVTEETVQGRQLLVCSFRGRILYGQKQELPDGFRGSVINQSGQLLEFDSIVMWTVDEPSLKSSTVESLNQIVYLQQIYNQIL